MSICKLNLLALLLALACLFQALASGQLVQKSNIYKQQITENENDDQNEDFSQLAETLAVSAAAAASNQNSANCEPIGIGLCSTMPYNFTRMANFFGDSSQIEAAERALQYEPLSRSTCSRHLLAYLCELLAPMCIENDSQKKFEIYPCRSYCRQVKRDCENQILDMAVRFKLGRVPPAFDCDSLPFEANGGEGKDRGPCHEMRDEGPQPSQGRPSKYGGVNNYRPYQKDLDMNVPPFITDNSPIDQRIIRPSNPAPAEPKSHPTPGTTGAGNQSTSTQLQSFGHQLAVGLMSYSNLLSVLTLVCLFLVVAAKRIKRLKNYLARRSSSSFSNRSSSSASSSDSRKKLAVVPALGQARKLALSPSSSSRSLVLVTADGKRGQPKHKLVHASELATGSLEPSQKLLHAGLDRRTLINVNGTLERQKQQQNAVRYNMMQSMGAGENASKHQYDYIQVLQPAAARTGPELEQRLGLMNEQMGNFRPGNQPRSAHANEPQVYSNILLSSPSHQVLLFGDSAAQQAAGRSHFVTAANLGSPYAQTIGANEPANLQQQQQRSFQRRPGGSGSSSSRFRRGPNTGATSGPMTAYVSSGASSASSSAGSTTSSFSPPESSSGNLLLANQFQNSPRAGRGV